MKKGRSHKRDRILQLTLEIIYLLTGEDYGPMKKPNDHVESTNCLSISGGWSRTHSPITDPLPLTLTPGRNHSKKILEVTQKIIELLTGEVPIRCQDVTVYFSMEEWEYLEGHKDLYKDVMMEEQPPLTSPSDLHNEVAEEVHLTIVKEENLSSMEHLSSSYISPPMDSPSYVFTVIKKEPPSTEEDLHQPDVFIPSPHTQHSSAPTKEIPLSADKHPPCLDSCQIQKVSTGIEEPSSGSGQCIAENAPSTKAPNDDKPYGCCGCGKSFETNAELIKHRKIHTGQKPYSCSECGKCFLYNSQLITHQRIHTGERPFPCSVCGKSFIKNAHLVTHQRSHTGEKPFSCPECRKCFVTNAVLRAHLRVHSGDKPFYCSECGKCFVSKSRLTKHRKYHSRVKPFSCSECGKAFLKNSDLTRHLRIHTGERPYCCSDCGKRFIQRSNLLLHQRTHTGQRPYSCEQCGRGFHCKTSLVKHQSNHTEKQLSSPNTSLSSGGPVPAMRKE